MILGILLLTAPGVFVGLLCGSVFLASEAARREHLRSRFLLWGAAMTVAGLVPVAVIAWSTQADDTYYDSFWSFLRVVAAIFGGALMLAGLGAFIPWLLDVLRRRTARLSPVVRLAARDVALGRHRTAAPIALTMVLTACAVVVTSVVVAQSAQGRAWYVPQARHGALLVNLQNADAAVMRAALQREVPADSVVRRDKLTHWTDFSLDVEGVDLPDVEGVVPAGFFGDQALLRYLTGNLATPFDEGTAVVVTSHDIKVDTLTVHYSLPTDDLAAGDRTKSVPAIAVKSPDRQVNEVFIPTTVIRDLGLSLEAESLIVDPSRHRTTAAELERIHGRLVDGAYTYLELGYQAPVAWMGVVAGAVVVALGGALVAGGRAGIGTRSGRTLLRAGGGSVATLRWFAAGRTGWSALCGAVPGAVAGCGIGWLLAWPMTTSNDEYDILLRVSFGTPWWAIAALAVGLPVLAGAIAALPRPPAPHSRGSMT
ncbi:hypothetical protein ACFWYW_37540 [Nonomuraea sp. NPDC059023]|uniref:hypothetical protein n=1 Tax=unclassified Nonomuraea TaxID=2593643 RepID=UPI0036BFB72F